MSGNEQRTQMIAELANEMTDKMYGGNGGDRSRRRTLYQLHAINELTKARFKSKRVFTSAEAARAYEPQFRTRCLARDRTLPSDCPIVIAELELEE